MSKEQTSCKISPMWRRKGHTEWQGNTKRSLTQWCKGLAGRFLCRGRVGWRILWPCYKIKTCYMVQPIHYTTKLTHNCKQPATYAVNLLHSANNQLLMQSTCCTVQATSDLCNQPITQCKPPVTYAINLLHSANHQLPSQFSAIIKTWKRNLWFMCILSLIL